MIAPLPRYNVDEMKYTKTYATYWIKLILQINQEWVRPIVYLLVNNRKHPYMT